MPLYFAGLCVSADPSPESGRFQVDLARSATFVISFQEPGKRGAGERVVFMELSGFDTIPRSDQTIAKKVSLMDGHPQLNPNFARHFLHTHMTFHSDVCMKHL